MTCMKGHFDEGINCKPLLNVVISGIDSFYSEGFLITKGVLCALFTSLVNFFSCVSLHY